LLNKIYVFSPVTHRSTVLEYLRLGTRVASCWPVCCHSLRRIWPLIRELAAHETTEIDTDQDPTDAVCCDASAMRAHDDDCTIDSEGETTGE
jgi:hypothetical protein